jgi:ADP-ribose pyrophosphatase YjhB (NUDIX family)
MLEYKVVPFRNQSNRAARRNCPGCTVGTILYAVQHPGGWFFHFVYTQKEAAQKIARKFQYDPINFDSNFKESAHNCLHTNIKADEING